MKARAAVTQSRRIINYLLLGGVRSPITVTSKLSLNLALDFRLYLSPALLSATYEYLGLLKLILDRDEDFDFGRSKCCFEEALQLFIIIFWMMKL
jgi:hypothetical protein